jgi:small-conductance mechanosensitive channel
MPGNADRTELDDRIAIARRNISELMEQATGASGAAVEESLANRLNEQQDLLNELLKQREAMG